MLVSKNQIETNKYELIITVDAEAFETAVQAAYKKNVKKFQVPGFRQGKAPRKTIEKLYGEQIFFEEAVNSVAPGALEAAYAESELQIVVRPEVEVTAVSKEEGVTFKAICVVKPEVTVSQYKGLTAAKEAVEVTEEEITTEIDRMRSRNARTVTVEDRAAQMDDTTKIDFEGFVDGVAF
ncbi:MAG: trigger factor, partial [Oscillospiraceae bacterium]|nr:trigger factor [Oscillospiraceae bacterium]